MEGFQAQVDPRRDDAAPVVSFAVYDIERGAGPKIDDDGRSAVMLVHCDSVADPVVPACNIAQVQPRHKFIRPGHFSFVFFQALPTRTDDAPAIHNQHSTTQFVAVQTLLGKLPA